jgi:hypothetical protein
MKLHEEITEEEKKHYRECMDRIGYILKDYDMYTISRVFYDVIMRKAIILKLSPGDFLECLEGVSNDYEKLWWKEFIGENGNT